MVAIILALMAWQSPAGAVENRSTLKVIDSTPRNIQEDKRITDNELRAQAGSSSRYSMKFDLSFSGPPIGNLSDSSVPNPDNRPFDDRTNLSGNVGLRYRVDSTRAWNVGSGVKWFTPYQHVSGQKVEKRKGATDYEANNPYIGYDVGYLANGVQMRSSVRAMWVTSQYYLDKGEYAGLKFAQTGKYNLGHFVLGMLLDFDIYGFNREYEKSDGRISNYNIAIVPSLEYRLTDKFYLRTSVGYTLANERRKGSWWLWQPLQPTGRVGFTWAITPEIYFNPYLNFFWERPAWRTTSLSFSTVFSVF